jgi:hypothetical protein
VRTDAGQFIRYTRPIIATRGALSCCMAADDAPEIEYSPFCGDITRDGITVRVDIYRLTDEPRGWALEVIDQEGASTVWDETFLTDDEAYSEFYRTLEREGIRSFAERPPGRVH